MRRWLGSIGLLCLGSCGQATAPQEPASEPSSARAARQPQPSVGSEARAAVTVATYNINFGNGHLPETVDTIADLDTDIVLLQESTPDSEEAVRARLSDVYSEIRFEHCCRAGGLGVLSKFPILEARVVDPNVGFFPAWWLRVETPNGPLLVVDVHLRPPISDSGSWVVGFFSTRDDRAREIAALWDLLPTAEPMIIAGDFNEKASGGVVKFLRSQGLETALPQFAGREPTWHWPVGAGELKMQLDHVTYSRPLSPRAARVVTGGLSDHQPVVVEFAWR